MLQSKTFKCGRKDRMMDRLKTVNHPKTPFCGGGIERGLRYLKH